MKKKQNGESEEMIQVERVPMERIVDLRSRLLSVLGRNVSRSTIGNMAIEAMLIRDLMGSIEEKGTPSKDLKEAARELRNVEKTIISLYMMASSGDRKRSWNRLSEDYTRSHEPFYGVGER